MRDKSVKRVHVDVPFSKGRIQAQLDFIRTNILGINGLIALENAR
jgi:hypothetical protein